MSYTREHILAVHRAGSDALARMTDEQAAQLWADLTTRGKSSLYIQADENANIVDWEVQP
jgi:hypothetical protein